MIHAASLVKNKIKKAFQFRQIRIYFLHSLQSSPKSDGRGTIFPLIQQNLSEQQDRHLIFQIQTRTRPWLFLRVAATVFIVYIVAQFR